MRRCWKISGLVMASVLLMVCSSASAQPSGLVRTIPHVHRIALPVRADPMAPAGADPIWLPKIRWVMERWLPFNANDLYRDLGIDNATQESWLYFWFNDGKTLSQLAERFGQNPRSLEAQLLRQRQATYAPGLYPTLLARTRLMFSQPHLAQHVLFHWFHDWAMEYDTRPIYGLSSHQVYVLEYVDHKTRQQIAASQGISYGELRRRVLSVEWTLAQAGVSQGALSESQAEQRQQQLKQFVRTFITQKLMIMR